MKREISTTSDGSSTLFVPELDEHYHSVHGAIQESNHVFIDAGYHFFKNSEINVLEIGLGTGLNAWLTAIESTKKSIKTYYTSIEKYPITEEEIQSLNYPDLVTTNGNKDLLLKIHKANWEGFTALTPCFFLRKMKQDFKSIAFKNEFDLIYYDAFAPSAQPNLWTTHMFSLMFKALKENGVLVTYCAKGQVKRNMKSAGFTVEAIPGPPGKREMTRAKK